MHRITYYAASNRFDRAAAWLLANAASWLPRPILVAVGGRLHRLSRHARRPRLRRLADRLTIIIVGDALSIRIVGRGK